MYEMRNIAKNSQKILGDWLNQRTPQSDEKVFIKDAINDSGKSLSVLGSNQSNDLLSSIMHAVGMQVQQQQLHPQQQQQQQYTITLDSHVQQQPLQQLQAQPQVEVKSEKQK